MTLEEAGIGVLGGPRTLGVFSKVPVAFSDVERLVLEAKERLVASRAGSAVLLSPDDYRRLKVAIGRANAEEGRHGPCWLPLDMARAEGRRLA